METSHARHLLMVVPVVHGGAHGFAGKARAGDHKGSLSSLHDEIAGAGQHKPPCGAECCSRPPVGRGPAEWVEAFARRMRRQLGRAA